MKRLAIICILLVLASCGGGGAKVSPSLGASGSEFALADTSLMGEGHLVATVANSASELEVGGSVEGARGLKGAYFTLKYPGEKYHPTGVEFSERLGEADEGGRRGAPH